MTGFHGISLPSDLNDRVPGVEIRVDVSSRLRVRLRGDAEHANRVSRLIFFGSRRLAHLDALIGPVFGEESDQNAPSDAAR
ncbi:hypothetical protein [Paludisphaera borealis]|uniref:hypothetical protein n=1 Tax=Paludisphaera borealis TaxID=1387353 RepID=UPI0009712AF8|nr:hypothetical protein [Paludisphaera borealis]